MPIRGFATEREVPGLVHFTRLSNLASILQYGIYPIARAEEVGLQAEINDAARWDGHRDGTSVSIGFPNSSMFFKVRQENPEVDWVVLLLRKEILWEKRCSFCRYNAADGRIAGQPIDQLTTRAAFEGMYESIDGHASREGQRLKNFDPTDVQAEVLVFDVIEPRHIIKVAFESAAVRDASLQMMGATPNMLCAKGKGFFGSRGYNRR